MPLTPSLAQVSKDDRDRTQSDPRRTGYLRFCVKSDALNCHPTAKKKKGAETTISLSRFYIYSYKTAKKNLIRSPTPLLKNRRLTSVLATQLERDQRRPHCRPCRTCLGFAVAELFLPLAPGHSLACSSLA